MMRKVICLLLALIVCLSLPCTAMAAVISPGQDGTAPTIPGGDDGVPDTGDNASIGLWLFLLLLALLLLVVAVVCYRKFMKQ